MFDIRPAKILTADGWRDGFQITHNGRTFASVEREEDALAKVKAFRADKAADRARRDAAAHNVNDRRAVTGHGRNPFNGMRGFDDWV